MKTPNNLKEKQKFFSLYFNQDVRHYHFYPDTSFHVTGLYIDNIIEGDYLLLKTYRRHYPKDRHWVTPQYAIDLLREDGYATPYKDLSIQDLLDYGWIKLDEE